MADNPKVFSTGLTKDQIAEAFRRALNDMTDAQIRELVDTKIGELAAEEEAARQQMYNDMKSMYVGLESRVTALEQKRDDDA